MMVVILLVSGVVLGIFGSTVFFLLRARGKKRHLNNFDHGFLKPTAELSELIKESQTAFEMISDNLEKQYSLLQDLLERLEEKRLELALVEEKPHAGANQTTEELENLKLGDYSPHEEAARLIKLGLNPEEIFKKVGISKGEIGLITKINQYRLSQELG